MAEMTSLPWGELAVSALSGGLVTKAADFIFGRKGREVRALGEAIESLSGELKKADLRMDGFGERLDDCHRQHKDCEEGRTQDRREIDGLKAQIELLMRGDVADYDTLLRPSERRKP